MHRRFDKLILAAAAIIAFPAIPRTAFAQGPSAETFRLSSVKFTGLKRFPETNVADASGLHSGMPIKVEDLSSAAGRLSGSGAFDKVDFHYVTQGGEVSAVFDMKESNKLVRCIFDNFVWFSAGQIQQTLERRIPLFVGLAPQSGTLVGEITNVLQGMIQSNSIAGTISVMPFSPAIGAPVSAMIFRIDGISLPIKSLIFPGASTDLEKALASQSGELVGKDVSTSGMGEFVDTTLLPQCHRLGYLRAQCGQPQAGPINSAVPSAGGVAVAVSFPVNEGNVYHWNRASWTGNHLLSESDLAKLLSMHTGAVANQDRIDVGFAAVKKAYASAGHIDFAARSKITFDDAAKLVSYDVAITEGIRYSMGHLRFEGFNERAIKKLSMEWRLKTGETFDGSYTEEFIHRVPQMLRGTGAAGHLLTTRLTRDTPSATVDVYLSLN